MKLYNSETWLKMKFITQGKTIEEIAKECNVQPLTIRRALQKIGLK